MNMRFLGQKLSFWLIAAAVFAATYGLFFLGGQDNAPDWLILIGGSFTQRVIISAAVMAIVSLGLNLIYGFNGNFSLGQWGFYAIGAYAGADVTWRWVNHDGTGFVFIIAASALLSGAYVLVGRLIRRNLNFMDEMSRFTLYLLGTALAVGLSLGIAAALGGAVYTVLSALPADLHLQIAFVIATLGGGALAALLSYLFGQPVLKLGGDYFGIATLGLTLVVWVLANNADSILPETKGSRGMIDIPVMTTWTWVFLFLLLVLVVLRNLLDSTYGRAIISVREDDLAARAMGIDTTQYKTMAFVVGSFFAGLAGSLYAHQEGFLHPSTFYFVKAFDPLIIIVFGGLGSVTGTVVASFAWALTLYYILPSILARPGMPAGAESWRYVIYPVALLLIMLLRQQGLLGGNEIGFLKSTKWPLRKKPAGEGTPSGSTSGTPQPALASAAAGGAVDHKTEAH